MTPTPNAQLSLAPSRLRRVLALGVIMFLTAGLAVMALGQALGQQAVLMGLAVMALAVASLSVRSWDDRLIWTADGLCNHRGTLLAARDQIVGVDRHALSLRPSQGFTLSLSRAAPRGWSPGLWWSFGRRIGVGGLTAPAATKALADRIALDINPS